MQVLRVQIIQPQRIKTGEWLIQVFKQVSKGNPAIDKGGTTSAGTRSARCSLPGYSLARLDQHAGTHGLEAAARLPTRKLTHCTLTPHDSQASRSPPLLWLDYSSLRTAPRTDGQTDGRTHTWSHTARGNPAPPPSPRGTGEARLQA